MLAYRQSSCPQECFGISFFMLLGSLGQFSGGLGGSWEHVGISIDFGILLGTTQIESTRSSAATPLIWGGLQVTSLLQLADLKQPTATTRTARGLDISDWKPFLSAVCTHSGGASRLLRLPIHVFVHGFKEPQESYGALRGPGPILAPRVCCASAFLFFISHSAACRGWTSLRQEPLRAGPCAGV